MLKALVFQLLESSYIPYYFQRIWLFKYQHYYYTPPVSLSPLRRGGRDVVVNWPTGYGKTLVPLAFAVASGPGLTLLLVHATSLRTQHVDTLAKVIGRDHAQPAL